MAGSLSKLHQWFDRDFLDLGAFLTTSDEKFVYFGKGGETTLVDAFVSSPDPIFYLKDFYQNKYLAYRPGVVLKIERAEVQKFISCWDFNPVHYTVMGNEEGTYREDFATLKASFSDDLQKVVLISRESYRGQLSILNLMRKAFEFGTGMPYGLWTENEGLIGSTPELLYEVDGQALKTFALAGTMKAGLEAELLASKKDRHEHNLVIQDIQEKLIPFARKTESGVTYIHPYKSIIHLRTNIESELKDGVNFTELTNRFSPTAALGGYPKEKSLAFLQNTNYAKKFSPRTFGSAFGLMSDTHKEFVVSIRNVQWKDNELFIESGGGVVKESILEKELEEIALKRAAIKNHYL